MKPENINLDRSDRTGHSARHERLSRTWRRGLPVGIVALACLVGAAGCAGPRTMARGGPDHTVITDLGPEAPARAARAGAAFQRNPKDAKAAVTYARALRELGSADEAAAVLATAASHHPNDKTVLAEYAKALTASGRGEESLLVFAAARRLNPRDWSLLSAEGIALDQIGRHGEARERYNQALKIEPNHPDVMTNLALSHSLSGNLSASEAILRRAARQNGAGDQVRHNLALVLALRGRFGEAEQILADLDPGTAQSNLAIMRQMFEQPALWAEANGIAPVGEVAAIALNPDGSPADAHAAEERQNRAAAQPAVSFSGANGITAAVAPRSPPPAAQAKADNRRAALKDPPGNDIDTRFFSFGD